MQYEYHTLHDYYTLYDQRQLVPGERFIRKRQAKIRLSAEEPLLAAIRMLAGLCLEIHQGGRQFEERLCGFPEVPIEALPSADYPTSLEAGRFVLRKVAGNAHLRWTARGKAARWFVAMRPNSGVSITDPARLDLKGFREVPLPQGVEAMSDPFVWETGGAIICSLRRWLPDRPKDGLGVSR